MKVKIYKIKNRCPGGFQAWCYSNVGIIRKPMCSIKISKMKVLLNKFQPADVIALVVLCFGFFLVYKGIDTITGALLSAVVFYYFGKQKRIIDEVKK